MFAHAPYIKVNREERHFCALFVHALLSSESVRVRFGELIFSKYGFKLDSEMEIFIEAAALRDYWNNLGDPTKYDICTDKKRRKVLNKIIEIMGYHDIRIDQYALFFTTNKSQKLWNPGHWNTSAIESSGLKKLLKVKWAFNAKPDIMLISNGRVILIEGKIESREGKYDSSGEGQMQTQELVAQLLKKLVPAFSNFEFYNMLLTMHPEKKQKWSLFITWEDVINITNTEPLDSFTHRCFNELYERNYIRLN
jgi:hypothetical protein